MRPFPPELRKRLRLLGLCAGLAVAGRVVAERPPEATQPAVAGMLGHAVAAEVAPDAFVWEESRGWFQDGLFGRHVLFLGAEEGGLRDVYRARVRVTREGRPLEVVATYNLTRTPLGDESLLTARGHHAAFATTAYAGTQGMTVLDLHGRRLDELPWLARAWVRLASWLEVGSWRGLGRLDVVFEKPPPSVKLELRDGVLVMALGTPPKAAALDLASQKLNTGGDDSFQPRAYPVPAVAKPITHYAMDTLRELLGAELADTLKALVFGARTSIVRFGVGLGGSPELADPSAPTDKPDGWPPRAIGPLFKHALEREGEWRVPEGAPRPQGGESYFMETVIRPDTELPFAEVKLVAIDTRQLELRIEAGFEEPRPLTGPPGRGRNPKSARAGLVGAVNGAFQTRHGEYGMVVDKRVLLPPQPGASSVVVDVHGRALLGSWDDDEKLPDQVQSLRQNLDPLIDGGVINPRGRNQWGFPLDGGSFLTERSALCLTESGHLIYAWGIELGADTLARGMQRAGCRHAIHLDMNPGHVGFVFIKEGDEPEPTLLTSEMSIDPRRFLQGSPKDFFYLTLRDARPHTQGEIEWKPDGGASPPPSWLAAVHRAEVDTQGTKVTLHAFAPERFRWDLRPGDDERGTRTALAGLSPAEQAHALVAIGLGVGLRKDNRRGLFLDGVEVVPIRADLGGLLVSPDGDALIVTRTVAPMAPRGDASELVLLAEGGELRSEANKLGDRRERGAACLLGDGTLLVAILESDSPKPLATALLDAGCRRVVDLDRGKQVAAFVHRAGKEPVPKARYDDTVLYGMAREAAGRALPLERILPSWR
jgi:hypothetical protein